jgi:DNA-binding transcriptional regulator WhiA
MDIIIKTEIIRDYTENFIGTLDLAAKYNFHRTTIQKILKEAGIKLRKKTPQINVNHFFFSDYNEFSCYWAGFILADGYIRSKNRFTLEIKLQKSDVRHLELFKKQIGFEGEVKIRSNYVSLSISSSQLISDLDKNFEIRNRKSLNCFITGKIPKQYLKDFIRGYFDGDGSITYTSTHTINFVGTYKTISTIRDYFFNECQIKLRSKDRPKIYRNRNVFVINYSGISAFKCIDFLYKPCKVYLNRKYNLYKQMEKDYNE